MPKLFESYETVSGSDIYGGTALAFSADGYVPKIDIEDFITTIEYDYPNFHLIMHCFKCLLINGYPKLLEHEDSKWLDKKNISDLKWVPADLALIDILK